MVTYFKPSGIDTSRATLANWCVQLGIKVQPFIDAMLSQLLNEKQICADETTVQVLREADREPQSTSYWWVYRSGEFVQTPIVIYDYHPAAQAVVLKRSCLAFLGIY